MAGAKNHEFHILPPSIWPLVGAFSALAMAAGGVAWMHGGHIGKPNGGGFLFFAGLAGVLFTMLSWWTDVVRESKAGDHTPVVSLHLRYGMILFIDPFHLPLLNTLILLCSGTTVTWAHHELIHGNRDGFKKGLWWTIALGALFTSIQAYEYMHAPFGFKGLNYGAAFFMATGFHGFHVLIGTIFLAVCLKRAYNGDFTPRQHFGFEAAAWYWHFVDVVWLFLFVAIYVWGGWGAPVHGG
jgi:cytochrome c oxidase subunit III